MYSFFGNWVASGSVHIFPCSRPTWKYINLSQIYECRNWKTEHYNSVLEITVSFLGIHNWEPDFYIGFSPALHLQWVSTSPVINLELCCECIREFSKKIVRLCQRIYKGRGETDLKKIKIKLTRDIVPVIQIEQI